MFWPVPYSRTLVSIDGQTTTSGGLDCAQCPAYLATQQDSLEMRTKAAAEWSKIYNATICPDDVFCDGCHSTSGRVFGHCKKCSIRACGSEKSVSNCGTCDDYGCDKIKDFISFAPDVKGVLDSFAALKKAQ